MKIIKMNVMTRISDWFKRFFGGKKEQKVQAQKSTPKRFGRARREPTKAELSKDYFLKLPRITGFRKTPSINHLKLVEEQRLFEQMHPELFEPKEKKKPTQKTLDKRELSFKKQRFFIDKITNRAQVLQLEYQALKREKKARRLKLYGA